MRCWRICKLLDPSNVRGATPLEQVTRHLRQQISSQGCAANKLCYVLFTDGEPSNKRGFELELRQLANETRNSVGAVAGASAGVKSKPLQSLFLTINLCTDEDEVVSYYNDLDQKLGNELSGMDVLDDLEAEQKEVLAAGNSFVTYCQELHVCRMAGCHSVLADLLDENALSVFHTVKLIKEVLRLEYSSDAEDSPGLLPHATYDPLLWLEDTEAYLKLVDGKNYEVFDFYARRAKPLIHVNKVKNKIWWYKLRHEPFPGMQLYRSCRERLIDSGWDIVAAWMKYPILILVCVLLLRTALV